MNPEEMNKSVQELLAGQNRILQILESDKTINAKGLVERVNDVEKTVGEIMINNKARAMAAGFVGGLITIIASCIAWIIKTGFMK